MQKKIEYPKNGIIKPWKSSKEKYYAAPVMKKCDRCKDELYQMGHVPFYGYETIGPRVYGIYDCMLHGKRKVRLEIWKK